jgi:hypothetical protein
LYAEKEDGNNALAVGGLPLAIELLGGYLAQAAGAIGGPFKTSTVKRLQELQDPAQRLQLAQVRLDGAVKEKELQEIIALSLDGAPAEVQRVFYALGAFAPNPSHLSARPSIFPSRS